MGYDGDGDCLAIIAVSGCRNKINIKITETSCFLIYNALYETTTMRWNEAVTPPYVIIKCIPIELLWVSICFSFYDGENAGLLCLLITLGGFKYIPTIKPSLQSSANIAKNQESVWLFAILIHLHKLAALPNGLFYFRSVSYQLSNVIYDKNAFWLILLSLWIHLFLTRQL